MLSLMDVETFGPFSFHAQQNGKLICHEPLFAYSYCSIESNNFFYCFLLYLIMLWILWVLWW